MSQHQYEWNGSFNTGFKTDSFFVSWLALEHSPSLALAPITKLAQQQT